MKTSPLSPYAAGACLLLLANVTSLAMAADGSADGQKTTEPQKSRDAQKADQPMQLEEITVTAQFRSQSVQEVPMSVTALDTASLEARGADQFVDYARAIPGLSFANRGANRSQIVIRGVSPITGEAAVGLYLDGVGQSNTFNNPDFRLFDVGRVEVLRGPQGTLYGEGSLGGTIKILTNPPNLEKFESKLEATGSDTSNGGFNSAVSGLVNIPLSTDRVALRLSGFNRDESGWIDNRFDGAKNINDLQSYGGRAALLFRLSDAFDVQGILNYQHDDVGNLDVRSSLPPEFYGLPPGTPAFGRYEFYAPIDQHEEQHNTQYTVLSNYRLPSGSIETVLGYNDEADDRAIDSITAGLPPGFPLLFDSNSKTKVVEARYLSALGGNFDFVLGAFGRDRKRDNVLTLPGGGALFGLPGDYVNAADFKTRTGAIFGEGYYKMGALTATVGLRWFNERVETPSQTLVGDMVLVDVAPKATFHSTTPKFGLSWQASDDVLLFANVAEGFRSGGSNPFPSPDPNYVANYKPDKAWSYELGVKSQGFDKRITANASVYYIDWKDLQILGVPTNPALGFVTNAGAAHSTGFEAELAALVTEGFELSLGAAYTEAELDDAAQGAPEGTRLANVPKWGFNASAEYRHALTARMTGFVRADWSSKSSTNGSVPPDPFTVIPSYEIANLRLGVDFDRMSFIAFVNNLTNNIGITAAAESGQYITRPRTAGLTVQFNF